MLAKQSWRLLHDDSSLLARVLKARYFPRASLLQATIGYNPSYSWRSIVASKEIIAQGYQVAK
ncbi:conserved hypothetical protein [Ricinus communis]|uniref:Reverse transcriptase zinc-binding domain-containing protein n=1 Tax=Ricinus communis TaxID=3988 RepID=B9RU93_RICCO|nr:conserved hypothetical protein [Ricinus communis]